jgi:[acyl-carrier-protein] S-malonyltransferase
MPLPVSAPFHTSMMKPAADRLKEDMAAVQFSNPETPVIHNVTAASEKSGDKIRELMYEQIYSPVRWVECAQALVSREVCTAVECGPGKVLAGLMKRIDKSVQVNVTETESAFDTSFENMNAG